MLIDQFMLANPQFIEKMATVVDEDTTVKNEVIREYGGKVIAVTRGTYRIERDPFAYTIVVHPEGDSLEAPDMVKDATETLGEVNIDTRCLAMLDRELLDDNSLLERYQQLWFDGQDKACRDLLRDNGGAVRYGFRRDVICLWPKNIEELTLNQDTQAAQEG